MLILGEATLTGYMRRVTRLYFHHLHLGVALLAVVLPLMIAVGARPALVVLSAVGAALTLDELPASLLCSHYPERKEFILTLALFAAFSSYLAFLSA